jgi:undecaprenyl-diphosphatase
MAQRRQVGKHRGSRNCREPKQNPDAMNTHATRLLSAPRGWTAHVALGAAVIVAAAWWLAPPLQALLQSAPVVEADRQVAMWLHARTGATLNFWMAWLSHVHGTLGILLLSAGVAVTAIPPGKANELFPCLIAAVPGGMLLNAAVKQAVQRARPDWGYAAETLGSFSFPSGHTAGATLFYGVLVVLAFSSCRRPVLRLLLAIAAAALVVLVAASRMVLGMHYLSDCVGAVIEALLWLALCLTGTPAVRRGFANEPGRQP